MAKSAKNLTSLTVLIGNTERIETSVELPAQIACGSRVYVLDRTKRGHLVLRLGETSLTEEAVTADTST